MQPAPHIRVWFEAAECSPDGCTDPHCPYMHSDAWFASLNGKHLGRGFNTEIEAREAAARQAAAGGTL